MNYFSSCVIERRYFYLLAKIRSRLMNDEKYIIDDAIKESKYLSFENKFVLFDNIIDQFESYLEENDIIEAERISR